MLCENVWWEYYQQVLVNFQVPIVVGQVCSSMKRCESLLVTLIDLRPVVEEVVNLHSITMSRLKRRSLEESGSTVNNLTFAHHVKLFISCRKM